MSISSGLPECPSYGAIAEMAELTEYAAYSRYWVKTKYVTVNCFGYIPGIGSIVGISRILTNNRYRHNENQMIKPLAQYECIRGVVELFPIVGGILCLIYDIYQAITTKNIPVEHLYFLSPATQEPSVSSSTSEYNYSQKGESEPHADEQS